MNLKFFFIVFIICQFQFIKTMDENLLKIIEEDNVELFENEINNGLNVNAKFGVKHIPILSIALAYSADKIAQLLILKGADVNAMYDLISISSKRLTPLVLALQEEKISVDTVKLLIDHGANINIIKLVKVGNFIKSNYETVSLFDYIYFNISASKKEFISNYLLNLYGKDVLTVALKTKSLHVIQKLIENGASIPEDIVEIAHKLKVNKKIISFLQRQFDVNKVISESIKCLPYELVDLIHTYSYGHEQDIDFQLLESLENKDIVFVKEYLKRGGNPNHIIKFQDEQGSLFLYAIDKEAEDIANLLMQNGANINLKFENKKCYISPLLLAFRRRNISIDFIEKMLNNGADINNNLTIKSTFKNVSSNISVLLNEYRELAAKKWIFLFNYLLKRFDQNVLDFVLENKVIILEVIKTFTCECNIKVTRHIVEKAMKLKHSPKIIKYLNAILQLQEQFIQNNIQLPANVLGTITNYHCIEETQKKEEAERNKCIIS